MKDLRNRAIGAVFEVLSKCGGGVKGNFVGGEAEAESGRG